MILSVEYENPALDPTFTGQGCADVLRSDARRGLEESGNESPNGDAAVPHGFVYEPPLVLEQREWKVVRREIKQPFIVDTSFLYDAP